MTPAAEALAVPAVDREGLGKRVRSPELMDDPGLETARHVRALDALDRINRVSLTAWRVWREIAHLHGSTGGEISVLDVACGGGDVLARVGRSARRAGVPVRLVGCDVSSLALERTRRVGGKVGVQTVRLDVTGEALPEGFDVVTSSLFLHHLSDGDAVGLLERMAGAAGRSLLIQDLLRTRLGYLYAWVALHTLTGSDVARTDGLRSVRGAFSLEEARALCRSAGLGGAQVERAWPQRFVVRWTKA